MWVFDMKIVCDSSGDLYTYEGMDFTSVPLKIVTAEQEYVDDGSLDVEAMVNSMYTYKGKSGTACPGIGDWLDAFDGEELIFAVTISSNLSGSYNAAVAAAEQYMQEHKGSRVFVVDSLSAGPGLRILVDKIASYKDSNLSGEEIYAAVKKYQQNTETVFSLESLKNLANNGRVSQTSAVLAGIIGIRVIGEALNGRLEVLEKARGEKKAIAAVFRVLKDKGYRGGKIIMHHCFNENFATSLKELITEEFTGAEVIIGKTIGLCSFYAERGGIIMCCECGNTGA